MVISRDVIYRDEAGFTLIEMLVGVFLLAFVSTVSLSIMSGYFKGSEVLENTLTQMGMLSDARRIIKEDMMHVTAKGLAVKFDQQTGKMTKERILLRFQRINKVIGYSVPDASALQEVVYFLKDNRLYRRIFDRPNAVADTGHRDHMLLSDVSAVELRFLFTQQWLAADTLMISNKVGIHPKALSLTLSLSMSSDLENAPQKSYQALFRVNHLGGLS